MIDEIHLQYPFMGSRCIRTELAKKGHHVNRKRIVRIMRNMGIGAIYPKPKTTLANKAHKVYPYLLRDIEVTYPNQAWAIDIKYIPMAKGTFAWLPLLTGIAIRCCLSAYRIPWIQAFVSRLSKRRFNTTDHPISSTQIRGVSLPALSSHRSCSTMAFGSAWMGKAAGSTTFSSSV